MSPVNIASWSLVFCRHSDDPDRCGIKSDKVSEVVQVDRNNQTQDFHTGDYTNNKAELTTFAANVNELFSC